MDIILHLQSVSLDDFLLRHPRLQETLAAQPPVSIKLNDPLTVISAESTYNRHAFSYVCQVAVLVGEQAPYPYSHLVASNVLAAASVEEGGMPAREFLDPHASLRIWMVEVAERFYGRAAPELPFAKRASQRMGDAYLWRRPDLPPVADRFAAMLGAHFASELLAAQQEFPLMVRLFMEQAPDLMDHLRSQKEPHFGFSAAAWLEGHPAVETKHAGFAARAAEAAAFACDDKAEKEFWDSFVAGFAEFCKNDHEYFCNLSGVA